ncbi:MAG: hypothetical protein ACK45Y_14240 [Betaproteobacteria bacterium]|jgi:hypothetical protein
MSSSNESSGLHKIAATDHQAAAEQHLKAAAFHDENKSSEAQGCAKRAMDSCNTAQKKSATACESTAKKL